MSSTIVSPLTSPLDGVVDVPASKSQLLRSLAAAALAPGRSHLYGATSFDDADAMTDVIMRLGAAVTRGPDPWTVDGVGGRPGVPSMPLDCRESGLTARIALALCGSVDGASVVLGRGRLPQRPIAGLIEVLEAQGVQINGDRLPIEVSGNGPLWGGEIEIDASQTTQFVTALMMIGPTMRNPLELEVIGLSSSAGYLALTESTLNQFGVMSSRTTTGYMVPNSGYVPTDVVIEPDASAAVYPLMLAALSGGNVTINGLNPESLQPDMRLFEVLSEAGGRIDQIGGSLHFDGSSVELEGFDLDLSSAPDGAMALTVAALTAKGPSRLRGLGSLRHKESNRLEAMVSEAKGLGASIRVDGNTVEIEPARLQPGTINPHGDHRIAMAFATLAGAGIALEVTDPQVVDKTWPGFWQILENMA